MRAIVVFLTALVLPVALSAQAPRTDATLRVTVVDPSGAVIVGARVALRQAQGEAVRHAQDEELAATSLDTGARGDVAFTPL